jgi:hypothetical protein
LIPELVTIGELASDSKIFLAIDINLNWQTIEISTWFLNQSLY